MNLQLFGYLIGIRARVRSIRRVFSLTVLGSGSAGNCSLIATNQCRLLVDARFGVRIYSNPLTAETLRRGTLVDFANWHFFATGAVFSVKDIEVQSFYVPHDAVDPSAFVFTADAASI